MSNFLTAALSGQLSHSEMVKEVTRMLDSMTGQLKAFRDVYKSSDVVERRNAGIRIRQVARSIKILRPKKYTRYYKRRSSVACSKPERDESKLQKSM